MRKEKLLLCMALAAIPLLFFGCETRDPEVSDKTEDVDPGTDPSEESKDPEKSDFKEEADDAAKDPVVTYDYSQLAKMGHPRVLMTQKDFDELKVKVTKDRFENTTLYSMHKMVLNLADDYVASGEVIEYKLDGKRLLGQSQKALKRLFACAYAYKLTGTTKYLQKATADLKTVCSFSDWHTSHFLDTGELALGVAIAYDWLYYNLSYEDRIRARRAMTDFAIKPSNGAGFHTSYGNWNQVCNAGVMSAAVACYEKDKANSVNVIENGITSNRKSMGIIYSPNGNYTEGYDYWGYGTGFQVIILRLLETAFGNCAGLDQIDGFMKTAGYMLFMAGPTGKDFPYSDGGVGSERPKLAMWWFAARQNDPSLLLNERRLMKAGQYPSSSEARLLPMIPCMIKDVNLDVSEDQIVVPESDFWFGRGETPIGIVHTGWKFDDTDRYLGIKGGKASNGHNHMDAGSFVFDALGKRWSNDYTRPSYGGIETALSNAGGNFWSMSQNSLRWDVARMNNLFHSTVSFTNTDGSVSKKVHPTDFNVNGSATIEQYYDQPDKMGLKLNMTAPCSDQVASAYRTITLIDKKYVRIVDEITAKSGMDACMMWRMLTPATPTIEASDIKLTSGGKTMYVQTSSSDLNVTPVYTIWAKGRPSDWTSRSWDGALDETPVGFTATVPAGKTVTFTTIISETIN